MTVAAEKYDRVHKARKTAPLLEGDDMARMKEAVSKLEKERDNLQRQLNFAKAEAEERAFEIRDLADWLIAGRRRLVAGDLSAAQFEIERGLSVLDPAWRVRA